ncbi:DUF5681 domain-containing protein [Bradyrhizobium sp. RT5a]|uniref:DUF5681 domain-containing protein n=1 Tax=Bradyrhizobium sp. RT5a TaxID=3156380 RepID=UPI0033962D55
MPVGTPFEPGKSGNATGRPKGRFSIKAEVERLMPLILKGEINPLTEAAEDMSVNRKIAPNLVMKAVADADLAAIKEVRDTLDGKPAQAVNFGGQEDNPVKEAPDFEQYIELPYPRHRPRMGWERIDAPWALRLLRFW